MHKNDITHIQFLDEFTRLFLIRVRAEGNLAYAHIELFVHIVQIQNLRSIHHLLAQGPFCTVTGEYYAVFRRFTPFF